MGLYTLMWTPTAANDTPSGFTLEDGLLGDGDRPEGLALALGFMFSEALVSELADIRSISTCPETPGVVNIQLQAPENVQPARKDIVVNSSCGICGPGDILQGNALQLSQVPDSLRLPREKLAPLVTQMAAQQAIFQQTGGSHGAAIFDHHGNIVAMAEDLGRHNALDKALGMTLLQGIDPANCGAVLSSRLSLEMVLKAVRSGLQIVLAVSAPTSLAIDVARKFGVTLCGFVREERATIYTHPQRICGVVD